MALQASTSVYPNLEEDQGLRSQPFFSNLLPINLRVGELAIEAFIHVFQFGPQGARVEFGRHRAAVHRLIEDIGQNGMEERRALLFVLGCRNENLGQKRQRQSSPCYNLV